jgi:hypothetical protein
MAVLGNVGEMGREGFGFGGILFGGNVFERRVVW